MANGTIADSNPIRPTISATHNGTYGRSLDTRKWCNREGLLVPAKESRVAKILAQDRKATGKTGDDHQRDSYQPDKYEWVHPDGGSGSGSGSSSDVVDVSGHAKHGDAWQRQHLSGITPVRPADPDTFSGSPITAHMGG
jgi:hypothetical protein